MRRAVPLLRRCAAPVSSSVSFPSRPAAAATALPTPWPPSCSAPRLDLRGPWRSARWFSGAAAEEDGDNDSAREGSSWPPVGTKVPVTLMQDDEVPTIRADDEGYYPEWVAGIAAAPDSLAKLDQMLKRSQELLRKEPDNPAHELTIPQYQRQWKLANRAKIKAQNESANDL